MSTELLVPGLILLATVGVVAALFVVGVGRAGRNLGEAPHITRRWASATGVGVALWLAVSGALAARGALSDFTRVPSPMLLLAAASGLITVGLACSPLGARLGLGLPLAWLIGFQAFRVPVELMLDLLYHAGAAPVQMSFEGRNFDIISGLTALPVAWLAARGRLPEWGLQLWNLLSLGLLLNIVVIAILSMPLPVRLFFNEPANTIVTTWPFVWLPVFLVQAALFGHLLIFRRLLRAHRPVSGQPARV